MLCEDQVCLHLLTAAGLCRPEWNLVTREAGHLAGEVQAVQREAVILRT